MGSGFANSAHGIIPVPAPATADLLADAGTPVATPIPAMLENPAELLTPTGAAILTTLAHLHPAVVRAVGNRLRIRPEGIAVAQRASRLDRGDWQSAASTTAKC